MYGRVEFLILIPGLQSQFKSHAPKLNRFRFPCLLRPNSSAIGSKFKAINSDSFIHFNSDGNNHSRQAPHRKPDRNLPTKPALGTTRSLGFLLIPHRSVCFPWQWPIGVLFHGTSSKSNPVDPRPSGFLPHCVPTANSHSLSNTPLQYPRRPEEIPF